VTKGLRNGSKPVRYSRRIAPSLLRAIFFVCLFSVATLSRAQSASSLPFEWNEAVHALAEKIAPALGSAHTFSIAVKDVSGSAPVDLVDLEDVGRALADQLATLGARRADGAADSQLQVTISRGVNGYLLVAQINGTSVPPAMVVPVANTEHTPGPPVAAPLLERRIVWQQTQPILDFARADADATHTLWYLLEPERIEIYEFSDGAQILHDAKTMGRAFASRDPRGRIIVTDPMHITTYLAGMQCDGTWSPTFSIQCRPIPGQQWPMEGVSWPFESPRNYFSGDMIFANSLDREFPAFYSAASPSPATGGQSDSLWIVAGIDGQAQLFDGEPEPVSTFTGWGSDIATLAPACGLEWVVLASGTGDWTQPDHLQLYEIKGQRAVAASQPLQLPGPVLTLWPESDGKSARVVVRNLETGEYEASSVSIACTN
jgi:hypothetical protein